MTKENTDERLGSEEPTKPGIDPPSVESAIRGFTLAVTELQRDCVDTSRALESLEGDERRRKLLELAEKMEGSSGIIGDASRVVRAIAELGG